MAEEANFERKKGGQPVKYAETKRPLSERERVREDTKIEGQFRGRPHSPAVIERALVLRPFRIPSTGQEPARRGAVEGPSARGRETGREKEQEKGRMK